MRHGVAAIFVTILLFAPGAASAETAVLLPMKDNTLYQDLTGTTSNGAGEFMFVGRTDQAANQSRRRALVAFDIAGNLPGGATITSVSLRLHVSRSNASQSVRLHRVLADWGEAGSDGGGIQNSGGGGSGSEALPGDVTWIHRFSPGDAWTTPGGDFAATASATTTAGGVNTFTTWSSTAALVADVQGWVNNPASNFGWVVLGNEAAGGTAKRYDTKENVNASFRPMLTVNYIAPPPAGAVPDGDDVPGSPLLLGKSGSDLMLDWDSSCRVGDVDYAVYEGLVGTFTSHVPVTCSTSGFTDATFTPAAGDRYYLVVPDNSQVHGSYGRDSDGNERPASGSACLPQSLGSPLCP